MVFNLKLQMKTDSLNLQGLSSPFLPLDYSTPTIKLPTQIKAEIPTMDSQTYRPRTHHPLSFLVLMLHLNSSLYFSSSLRNLEYPNGATLLKQTRSLPAKLLGHQEHHLKQPKHKG